MLGACSGGGSSASTTTTSTTTTIPTFTGDPKSEFCTLLKHLDLTPITGQTPADASIEGAFKALIVVFGQAAAVAPPEIKADVTAVGRGVQLLDEALQTVDYDFDRLPPQIVASTNDPAFAEAGLRITAYRTQVCHL